jgi:CheY-like chemotaxis protein
MRLESLLLTRDPEIVCVFQPALEKLFIDVEICRGISSGQEILSTEKFDAVIVDCDDLDGGLRVIESLRTTPSNKNSVSFAILNGKTTTQQAFQSGANFVLQKPIVTLNVMRCFRTALNFMVREQRRYFRHPVDLPAMLESGEGQAVKVTITNISESGMAIFFRGRLPMGSVSAKFVLPMIAAPFELKVQVAWMDDSGRMGLRFVEFSGGSRKQLEQWLTEQGKKTATGQTDQSMQFRLLSSTLGTNAIELPGRRL